MKFVKHFGVIAVMVLIGVAMYYIPNAISAPTLSGFATRGYENNGDTRTGFAVTITSTAWTEVLPASASRRYAIVHTTSTTIAETCLSGSNTAATTCTATLAGIHFPYVGTSIEDRNEGALYARVLAGSGQSVYLLGEKQHDSAD